MLKIKPRITPPVSSGRLSGALMTFPVILPAYLSINHIYLLRPAPADGERRGPALGRADRFSINNILWAQSAARPSGDRGASESAPSRRGTGTDGYIFDPSSRPPSVCLSPPRPPSGLKAVCLSCRCGQRASEPGGRAGPRTRGGGSRSPVGLENPVSSLPTPNHFNVCLKKTKPFPPSLRS